MSVKNKDDQNRRRHDRQTVRRERLLTAEWNGRTVGTVLDFSRGGMKIHLSYEEKDEILESDLVGALSREEFLCHLENSIGISFDLDLFHGEIPVGTLHAALMRIEEEPEGILLGFRFESIREKLLDQLISLTRREG